MFETVDAIKLPWNTVSECISIEVSKILGRSVICKANVDDYDYWTVQFPEERIPLSELYKLMEVVNAGEKVRNESLPESAIKLCSVKDVSIGLAELLLGRHLGLNWNAFHLDEQCLWLLDIKEAEQNEA